jgi:hypothetical protein
MIFSQTILRDLSAAWRCDTKAVTFHGPIEKPTLKTIQIWQNILRMCVRSVGMHRGLQQYGGRFDVGDFALACAGPYR